MFQLILLECLYYIHILPFKRNDASAMFQYGYLLGLLHLENETNNIILNNDFIIKFYFNSQIKVNN